MIDEQQFLNMIYKHKGETIKVLTEMWERWKHLPEEDTVAAFKELMELEEYDDALSTIIRMHTKRAPVA